MSIRVQRTLTLTSQTVNTEMFMKWGSPSNPDVIITSNASMGTIWIWIIDARASIIATNNIATAAAETIRLKITIGDAFD